MMQKLIMISLALVFAAAVGCDREPAAPAVPEAALPAGLILDAEPQEGQTISAVRGAANDGDMVTVRGWIGGRQDPIAANRAIFTLVDASVAPCNTAQETCPTPWDACCEPAEAVAANSVTVQVVDAEGKPLRASLNGAKGIAPLKQVVVTGKLHLSPDRKSATINATGVFVTPT